MPQQAMVLLMHFLKQLIFRREFLGSCKIITFVLTSGKDAMGEVYVNIDVNGRIVRGRAVSTDIIEASAKAYLNAINKVVATKPKYAHIEVKNKRYISNV